MLAGVVAGAAGSAALLFAMVALGLLLTRVLFDPSGHWDDEFNRWLAEQRTPLLTDLSWLGSMLSDTITAPGIVVVTVVVLALRRRAAPAVFYATAICLEGLMYAGTVLIVARDRPPVVRLEDLPVDASFPSGHVAAAVVTYVGLALVVTSFPVARWLRVSVWVVAVIAPAMVVASRLYRGMHHPSDVVVGALMGAACLWIALTAVRVTEAARRAREEAPPVAFEASPREAITREASDGRLERSGSLR